MSVWTPKRFWQVAAVSEAPGGFTVTLDGRAVKTPATMQSEIAKGEKPAVTSFVGASAAPSHSPAAMPQITPSMCGDVVMPRAAALLCAGWLVMRCRPRLLVAARMQQHEQQNAKRQHQRWNPELHIGQDGTHCLLRSGARGASLRHGNSYGVSQRFR